MAIRRHTKWRLTDPGDKLMDPSERRGGMCLNVGQFVLRQFFGKALIETGMHYDIVPRVIDAAGCWCGFFHYNFNIFVWW